MLRSLHIENIAVIEKADIEFSPGLNVLTGETGAGKSIVIDSIEAVLGARTSRELVRTGAEKAAVSAVFDADAVADWCRENDMEEEDELILQRRISADGKSSARVNGMPVTAAQLRELGALLLDIHGQNDGRQLLNEKLHLGYLDRFAVSEEALTAFDDAYKAYSALRREKQKLSMDELDKAHLEESLRQRVTELEKAQLRAGEEDELSARRDLLRNSEKLTEQLDAAYDALYGGDESAVSLCGDAAYAAERAAAWCPELEKSAAQIREAAALLEDAAESIREKQADLDFSPEEYDKLEERLSLLRRLEKRYMTDEAGLIQMLDESRRRLDELEYAGDRLEKLERELQQAEKKAAAAAAALSKQRKLAAKTLQQRVEAELRDLSMPSVRFEAAFEPIETPPGFDSTGADKVRFVMSANAGEALGPISRIASGGELSRIMLALKNVFAQRDPVPTQIFDEVDAGVSGIAAQRIGEKLAALSRAKQVLCVTHLPQIAAMADAQLLVRKEERAGRTYTAITELDREGRCEELARITGGGVITDALLESVGEMLDQAEKFRASLLDK